MIINPNWKYNRPRDWAFDAAKRIKARSLDPRPYLSSGVYSLPQLLAMREARRRAQAIGLRAIREIARCSRTREQKQRVLNELVETLSMAWLGGQLNTSKTTLQKPDACASNGQVPRIAMQRKHRRQESLATLKRMRGGLWPENRRSGAMTLRKRTRKTNKRRQVK